MKKIILSSTVIITFAVFSLTSKNKVPEKLVTPIEPSTRPIPQPSGVRPTSQPLITNTFKDGEYIGNAANAYYGYIQVSATIRGGRLTDVRFLQYPNDRSTSVMINTQAMPLLRQEAIQAQSGKVDIISGATDSSLAFIESLTNALGKAR